MAPMEEATEKRFLFYVEQDYSFAILRPLQEAASRAGHHIRWLIVGDASASLLGPDDVIVPDARAAISFSPDAVFAPGDRIPSFIPGLKVQVFHGINEDKRGTLYPEKGLFDLYCTEGFQRTQMLKKIEDKRDYFRVVETGWLKLDSILNHKITETSYSVPQILFASTFTPALSGAETLYTKIKELSQSSNWHWLVTLHPKMAKDTVAKFRDLENDNLSYFPTEHVVELLHRANIMVSDNSSILQEFLILKKPVITFRNRNPLPCMIEISQPQELEEAIHKALKPPPELTKAIAQYGPSITPYLDGASANRVLKATLDMLDSGWTDSKPKNYWRNLKMRRQLKYFGFN